MSFSVNTYNKTYILCVKLSKDTKVVDSGYFYIFSLSRRSQDLELVGQKYKQFFFLKLQTSIHLEEKCYVHNIFVIFLQKIVSNRLLLVVMSE